jgi:nucleoside phosphorylase
MAAAPKRREEFHVAIVCALSLEYDAVSRAIEEFWDDDGDRYGRAPGDVNTYTTGRMGDTNVVVVLLSNMGKSNAAGTAASLRSSYPCVRLALLVGICGGAPKTKDGTEILLDDVIISKSVVQYDLVRLYADSRVVRDTVEDALGRPTKDIRSMVAMLETDRGRERLENKAAEYLRKLQAKPVRQRRGRDYTYPGPDKDHLYPSDYQHKHHSLATCICAGHKGGTDPVCEASRSLSCEEVGCDLTSVIKRDRIGEKRRALDEGRQDDAQAPWIFVGRLCSGDSVIKSAAERERLFTQHNAIGWEMEGAGVWDEVPCLVVKGVCDYADSHKDKSWQNFAAATAASTAKALLALFTKTDMALSAAATPSSSLTNGQSTAGGSHEEVKHD